VGRGRPGAGRIQDRPYQSMTIIMPAATTNQQTHHYPYHHSKQSRAYSVLSRPNTRSNTTTTHVKSHNPYSTSKTPSRPHVSPFLQRRKEKQITYNTYLQQIKNPTTTLEKAQHAASLQPPSTANDAKISDAQKSLETARHSSQSALNELIQVTERVFREMDRFKRDLDGKLRRVYVQHGRVQMDYSRQLEGEYVW
jgi:hypothetical protein